EALGGDGVEAAFGRGGDDLVAALAQNGDGLRADQSGATDDDDLHGLPPLSTTGAPEMSWMQVASEDAARAWCKRRLSTKPYSILTPRSTRSSLQQAKPRSCRHLAPAGTLHS